METLDRIRALAAKQFGPAALTLDADAPIEQVGADSLGLLEFVFELEETFDVSFDQEAAKTIRSLRGLAALIDQALAAKPPADS